MDSRHALFQKSQQQLGMWQGIPTIVKAARELEVAPFMTWNQNSKILRSPRLDIYQRGSSRIDNLELFRVIDWISQEIFCHGVQIRVQLLSFYQLCHQSDRR